MTTLPLREVPGGPFQVIYADPPYRHKNTRADGSAGRHDRTMSTEEIAALPVSQIAAHDALLFLWVPGAMFPEALEIVRAWGFRYLTHAVWDKRAAGVGFWIRGSHEDLVVAKRGEPPRPTRTATPESVFIERRGARSAKPPAYHGMIVRMSPWATRRIELCARGRAPRGWVFWGDEAVPGSGGRPRAWDLDRARAVELRMAGRSLGEIASIVDASRDAVAWAVRGVSNPRFTGLHTPFRGGSTHPESEGP